MAHINTFRSTKFTSLTLLALATGSLSLAASCSQTELHQSTKVSTNETEGASAAFLEMSDRHASRILKMAPEWATQLGVDESVGGVNYSQRLPDYSRSGNKKTILTQQTTAYGITNN